MKAVDFKDMAIIERNFFKILQYGAFDTHFPIEPMSSFKWKRLIQMVEAQGVVSTFIDGINKYASGDNLQLPEDIVALIKEKAKHIPASPFDKLPKEIKLSNSILNHRLQNIIKNEIHAIDTSVETIDLLKIIIINSKAMLNHGMSLEGIISLGKYLRTSGKGDRIDVLKLEKWISYLFFQSIAQLQGNILISVFGFDQDEIPFVEEYESRAYKLTMKSISDLAKDTAQEWHFRQNSLGFVRNNNAVLRRNLRRSFRYINYFPIETVSNFINNFTKSLKEIEE
ncbi:hypothetical protein [uncultured Prevotella sp.]|uniref:hypothetical protein n=1 Tax=uncultured Prevotella sp. TaxID=159272 RepID=UPI0025902461|nr:hypothetical protein [uncultured Prevotella sp.]